MQPDAATPDATPAPSAEPTTTTPAAPSEAPQPATQNDPSGSEAVQTPAPSDEQHVPYSRFQEVNDKSKQAAAELEKANERIAELEAASQPPQPSDEEPGIDPDVQKELDKFMKSRGYVTQEELSAKEMALQAAADVKDLKSEFSDFDENKVLDYAKENGLSVSNKSGMRSVYQMMKSGDPAFKEGIKNELLAELKDSGQLAGPALERPGPGGAAITPGEKPVGTRNILRDAIQRHRS